MEIAGQTVGVLRQDFAPGQASLSFAHTNALLMRPLALPNVIAHFWTAADTVILGLLDQRLPGIAQARQALAAQGYESFFRNSGGLGVVADAGVLNVSLFVPPAQVPTITAGYQLMADWIQEALPECPVEIGEVPHSYCPGSFDLSIAGRKFAGLAQRRNSRGVAVMAYLSLNGDQLRRGQLMHDFYQSGSGTPPTYPDVQPATMTTLADELTAPLTTTELIARLMAVLKTDGARIDASLPDRLHDPAYQEALAKAAAQLAALNQ
ncbi:lipoyl protein ligase domain-containing protein [Lacticaseibacillus yichunensis]|uniref:Lipoate--protein ligase family protein n=1 Tax=Lacticaseibacillus yichunensis TaxID=2486015 RepID=A0ABW4CS00_9LACO|nr:lipoate--protein ligase family protein [Lacticaseibacillus yichunensis]